MSLVYRVLYTVGFTPWEEMPGLPIAGQVHGMFDRVEADQGLPLGDVLDLGCGTGNWAVELARRGWRVTGVDQVPKALKRAQARAVKAGVNLRLVHGDITALDRLGLGRGFRLIMDFGTVHGLSHRAQQAVALQVNRVAAREANLLMLAFTPKARGPLPHGMSRQDIEEVYRGWEVVEDAPQDLRGVPGVISRAEPRWYRLHRG